MPQTETSAQHPYVGDWARSYDERRFTTTSGLAFDQLERDQLLRALESIPPSSSALEVGCGTGRFFSDLLARGLQVTGLEPSMDMLEIVREKYGSRVARSQGSGQELPFADDHFDFVYSIRVLNQMGDKFSALQTLREMVRVTKPGGTMLVEFANCYRPGAVRASNTSTRLSFHEVKHEVASVADVDVLDERGILILSQSMLDRVPAFLVPAWVKLDQSLSRLFVNMTARGYITFRVRSSSNAHGIPG